MPLSQPLYVHICEGTGVVCNLVCRSPTVGDRSVSPVTACDLFIAARLRTVSDLCVILPRTNTIAKKLFYCVFWCNFIYYLFRYFIYLFFTCSRPVAEIVKVQNTLWDLEAGRRRTDVTRPSQCKLAV